MMPPVTPPSRMQPEAHRFADDGRIPNSPLPVLIYRGVLDRKHGDLAAAFEALFAGHDWRGAWRDGIYPFHHFHSTTHEVLGVARGRAQLRLGGEGGRSFDLLPGDAVVIPAGVGHMNEGSTGDLLVVGAYPEGRSWDLRRGDPAERAEVLTNLGCVPLPETDPVHGREGPLPALWPKRP